MNGKGIIDIIRERMFLVSIKACDNLFSLNNTHTHPKSTQQDINDNQLQKINKTQSWRSFSGRRRVTSASVTAVVSGRALRA